MTDPYLLVVVQLLDGITAASLGVMVPLMIADITRGTGHFNFAQGIVGTAVGIGASISPTLAGYLSDQFGSQVAFLGLAGIAAVGARRRVGADAGDPAGGRRAGEDAVDPQCIATRRLRGIRVRHDVQPRRRALHQLAIDREIVERHAARREALLELLADRACATDATADRPRRSRRPRPRR